jgi:hypothetical protein
VQLARVQVGPYEVWTWTQPDPPRVGRLDVSVAVYQPDTRTTVEDVEVRLTAADPAHAVSTSAGAAFDAGWFSSLYQADLELRTPGRWRITVAVTGPTGGGTAAFELNVLPPAAVSWWLIGAAATVVLWLVWWTYRATGQSRTTSDP